jgi:hypothetical protein
MQLLLAQQAAHRALQWDCQAMLRLAEQQCWCIAGHP